MVRTTTITTKTMIMMVMNTTTIMFEDEDVKNDKNCCGINQNILKKITFHFTG